MRTLYTLGLGALAPWVAAVLLQRISAAHWVATLLRRLSDFLSRPPQPTR